PVRQAGHRYFRELVGERYGIRWIEQYWLAGKPFEWGWDRALLADLFPATRVLSPGEHPFDAGFVIRDTTMLIEPDVYLGALVGDFRRAGGRIETRAFGSAGELASLPEPLVFNCTGAGAKALFGDGEMVPIKGQLSVLPPQPEVDYVMARDDIYMFPRRDGIVLGGTFEPGVLDLEPNPREAERVLRGHAEVFGSMRGAGGGSGRP
ncbi:MAG TPA: FAD-dependent oxidoreductase, partial [Longimicrobiaceae bacterium]|nr:FAD-dependent oxidoreductase [Longimicrobiaceae bacterium]